MKLVEFKITLKIDDEDNKPQEWLYNAISEQLEYDGEQIVEFRHRVIGDAV